MRDVHGRDINYLRVAVTDRCNLRCRYCMPEEGLELKSHRDILRLEEIVHIVKVAAKLGLNKIRLTGGEPLIRKNLDYLIRELTALPGIEDLALTTNGTLLEQKAHDIKQAGLNRVNISLDTLNPDKFSFMTRGGDLKRVLAGVEAALACGLDPVKINVVITRGVNEDEVEAFAALSHQKPLHIRFIELMPLGQAAGLNARFLPVAAVQERLERVADLVPVEVPGNGPARYFRLPGAKGTLGFIAALSQCFCSECNRLRLTADGKLRPCLESDWEVDLIEPVRSGATEAELAGLFEAAVAAKPKQHGFGMHRRAADERAMWQIGG